MLVHKCCGRACSNRWTISCIPELASRYLQFETCRIKPLPSPQELDHAAMLLCFGPKSKRCEKATLTAEPHSLYPPNTGFLPLLCKRVSPAVMPAGSARQICGLADPVLSEPMLPTKLKSRSSGDQHKVCIVSFGGAKPRRKSLRSSKTTCLQTYKLNGRIMLCTLPTRAA